MQNYKGYSIPSVNDLSSLGYGIDCGNVYMKDPNGKSVDLGISITCANIRGDGFIYEAAIKIIDKSLNPDVL